MTNLTTLFATLAAAALLAGCGPSNVPCRGLKLGQPAAGLPKVNAVFVGPGAAQPGRNDNFAVGPASEYLRCGYTCKVTDCSGQAGPIDCSSPSLAGADAWRLGAPYSYLHPSTDSNNTRFQVCMVGVDSGGNIAAVWSGIYQD